MLGIEVLVLATAAAAEVGARGIDALGGRLQDAKRTGVHDAFGNANRLHLRALSGKEAWRQHRPARVVAESIATVHKLQR
jgi:hypothetical protein